MKFVLKPFSTHLMRRPWPAILLTLVALVVLLRPTMAGEADSPLDVRILDGCTPAASGMNYVAIGLGMDGITSAVFEVDSLPARAMVTEAWLYWSGNDSGSNAGDDPFDFNPALENGDPTIQLNGQQVQPLQRQGGPAYWADNRYAYAYRADVSSIVQGNGVYTLSGMDNFDGDLGFNNGAELLILYSDSDQTASYIGIAEGLDLAFGHLEPFSGPGTRPVFYTFAPAPFKRRAHVTLLVGGVGFGGTTRLWTASGTGPAPAVYGTDIWDLPAAAQTTNPFSGLHNANANGYWDSLDLQLSVPAGAQWLGLQVESDNLDKAELEWVAAFVRMDAYCSYKTFVPLLLQKKKLPVTG